jgi:dienelactone hydrolase/pimeloyl-ACP methyl ester carboxylesterase
MLTRRQMLATSAAAPFYLCPPASADDPTKLFSATDKPTDYRLGKLKTLDDYFPFKVPKTLAEWEARRTQLREQLLVANGLWPLPEKTPLNPVVHGKVERDGYTVEKVHFESQPGHSVSGNLYRPAGTGQTPRPAVLFAHGHWAGGRFEVAKDAEAETSVKTKAEASKERAKFFMQAIPITLARLGFVVFQYDMIGYADSKALDHRRGLDDAEAELRSQSIMGLQTWNSVRALDFVSGLPGVDPKRIGMTGASGGGTQTFVLAGIDDRLAAAFPAVMVSAQMQGGCVCENCSLLRVNTGNVEIAALFAPKPLAMSCAKDWTQNFLKDGYGLPELKKLYGLYGKQENVEAKAWLEYGHNYNQPAREFMYAWFRKHLLGQDGPVEEPPFAPLPVKELSVYDDQHPRPKGEKDVVALRKVMTARDEAWLKSIRAVTDAASLGKFRDAVGPALRAMVNSELPKEVAVRKGPLQSKHDGFVMHRAVLGRQTEQDAMPCVGVFGPKYSGEKAVIWVSPKGKASVMADGNLDPALKTLVDAGYAVVAGDVLGVGEQAGGDSRAVNATFAGYTYGYNRSLLANRVHDVLTLIAFGKSMLKAKTLHLVGWGEAGPWAVLAKAMAGDAVTKLAADGNQFSFDKVTTTGDAMLLPGARKFGGMASFIGLCAPGEVLVHNAPADAFVKAAYTAAGAAGKLTHATEALKDERVVEWLLK